jgi:hypothetical protein
LDSLGILNVTIKPALARMLKRQRRAVAAPRFALATVAGR